MSLPQHDQRLLRRIDRALCQSDPDLASMLSIFTRLNAGTKMPHWEQLKASPSLAWRVLLWPAAFIAYVVVFIAGGGASRSRGAAFACTTVPACLAGWLRRVSPLGPQAPQPPAARRDLHRS